LSIKSRAHYTKIELSNFDEYTIAMEKKWMKRRWYKRIH
jgi:hypothetical protein